MVPNKHAGHRCRKWAFRLCQFQRNSHPELLKKKLTLSASIAYQNASTIHKYLIKPSFLLTSSQHIICSCLGMQMRSTQTQTHRHRHTRARAHTQSQRHNLSTVEKLMLYWKVLASKVFFEWTDCCCCRSCNMSHHHLKLHVTHQTSVPSFLLGRR